VHKHRHALYRLHIYQPATFSPFRKEVLEPESWTRPTNSSPRMDGGSTWYSDWKDIELAHDLEDSEVRDRSSARLRPAAKTRTRIHSEEGRAGRGYDVHRERVFGGDVRGRRSVIVPEGMLKPGWGRFG